MYNKSFKRKNEAKVSSYPFPKIPYYESLSKYGTDKPDLRNPLIIKDYTKIFDNSGFKIFAEKINSGFIVKGIVIEKTEEKPRENIIVLVKINLLLISISSSFFPVI